jgi:hypothetical protein
VVDPDPAADDRRAMHDELEASVEVAAPEPGPAILPVRDIQTEDLPTSVGEMPSEVTADEPVGAGDERGSH